MKQWVRQGKFREDLYYRLSVMSLVLPPLRSRRGDLRVLAEHFMRMYAPQGQTPRFTPAAWSRLQQHPWPGNIRELRNVVRRALMERQGTRMESTLRRCQYHKDRAAKELGLARSSLFKRRKHWGLSSGEE